MRRLRVVHHADKDVVAVDLDGEITELGRGEELVVTRERVPDPARTGPGCAVAAGALLLVVAAVAAIVS